MGTTKNMYRGFNCRTHAEQCMPTVEGQVNLKSADICIRLKDISPPENSWEGGGGGGGGEGPVKTLSCDNQLCTKEFTCRVITSQLEFES